MKILNENFILTAIGLVIIGAGVLFQPTNTKISSIKKQELKAYNHTSTSILDNVFTENGQKILPLIFNNSSQSISKEKLIEEFRKSGLTVKNISTSKIGTGTQITVNENSDKYNVLVYGDANGDGRINLIDAQRIILQYLNQGTNILGGSYIKAANVNNTTGAVNLVDAQRVILFYLGELKTGLVTNEPISDKEKDKEKPVITLNGSDPQKIKFGTKYTELGAVVTDNVDKNIPVQINSTNVNTNKVGTYNVTYNAKDSSGNIAKEVVRSVIVENYVTGIELTNPKKVNYVSGETIDKTGMIVNAIMADGTKKNITAEVQLNVNIVDLTTNKVKVSYETNNTVDDKSKSFEKTFDITVVNPISKIQVEEKTTTGYRYEQINIANLKSGENEEYIDTTKLTFDIEYNGSIITDDTAKISVTTSGSDGTVKVMFSATKKGTYKITPKLASIIAEDVIEVLIEENLEINEVILGDIPDNFRVGDKPIIISIDFVHKYENGENVSIDVKSNNLNINSTGIDIKLLDENKTQIISEQGRPVKYIALKAEQQGTQTITIRMNDNDEFLKTKQINILEKLEDELILGTTNITLYKTKPEGNDMVKEDESFVYTLIPISIKNGENTIKIKASELANQTLDAKCVKNNGSFSVNVVTIQGYKKNTNGTISKVSGDEEIDYVGISLIVGGNQFMSNGDKIIITYGELSGELTVTLGI